MQTIVKPTGHILYIGEAALIIGTIHSTREFNEITKFLKQLA